MIREAERCDVRRVPADQPAKQHTALRVSFVVNVDGAIPRHADNRHVLSAVTQLGYFSIVRTIAQLWVCERLHVGPVEVVEDLNVATCSDGSRSNENKCERKTSER